MNYKDEERSKELHGILSMETERIILKVSKLGEDICNPQETTAAITMFVEGLAYKANIQRDFLDSITDEDEVQEVMEEMAKGAYSQIKTAAFVLISINQSDSISKGMLKYGKKHKDAVLEAYISELFQLTAVVARYI